MAHTPLLTVLQRAAADIGHGDETAEAHATAVQMHRPSRRQFLAGAVTTAAAAAAWRIGEALNDLSLLTLDAVRALAIGCYATFTVLALAVIRRGGRARTTLVWVTILFLLIAGTADPDNASFRWSVALIIVGAAALTMTSRLRSLNLT